MKSIEDVRERFPNLIINEQAEKRFQEIFEVLPAHPAAEEVFASLEKQLKYLNDYGGTVSEEDPRRRFQVRLGGDMSPMSFGLVWEKLDEKRGGYVYSWQGGLQCNAVHQAFGSVQIGEPQWWSVHT